MEESKGSEQKRVQKIVKEFEEKIQQAARMAGEKDTLNEDEKKKAEDLFKSIQGHMTWISRYEKDMDHHSKNLRGFSTEVANALASKVSMQRSKISDKMEELFTIYEHRDLDTAELDAQLNGVHKKTQEVLDNIETVIALALEERKEDSVIERSYREGDGTGLQKDGYPGAGGARLTDQDGQTPGMGSMGAMALAGNTLDGFHFQQGWPGSTSADGFDSNQMGSAAFEKAKQQFDPSGLFLPTPVLSGLTPDEQKSIERMHIESLKKLPNITLLNFSGKSSEDYEKWKAHFIRIIHSQPSLTKPGKLTFLLQSLKGKAFSQIEEYTCGNFSDQAYDKALQMLDKLKHWIFLS